ncbi:MAG: bifunctional folylpolyglutamate synthase/dihydrofolate synthase [Alphaproteobacteria bacterium]|nr:bifunctional folylpolyglutamate synthase/dihydrofolate synthase [Alphaproteobacteria bacterium]
MNKLSQKMPDSSQTIIERFRTSYGKDIDLSLRPAYHDLLEKLGNPQNRLPPVFHVAGTNGKGSTCAFMRAMFEAAGYKVHVYTSPHLVNFHERIRIAGRLISEEELAALLAKAERLAIPHGVSYFEASTAVALDAFAQHPADFTILETGLGGRLDATNVVPKPLATIITRLSYDHREYLGDTLSDIAREKAGIMRAETPCYVARQPEPEAIQSLRQAAADIHAPLFVEGKDWTIDKHPDGAFRFADATRTLDLPPPGLIGIHQYQNASLAIAALSVLRKPLPIDCFAKGLRNVEWPARLERLKGGRLDAMLPEGAELWLDGGHNDSAGEVLAAQIARWRTEDGPSPKPLYIVLGMLTTKRPAEFLGPFAKEIALLRTVPVPHEPLSFTNEILAGEACALGISAAPSKNAAEALRDLASHPLRLPPRVLICGSLYLAGDVLAEQTL